MKKFWILKIVVFVILAAFALGGVVMLLWNALMPHLFHLPYITYWEGLGLLLLSRILFGFKGRPGGHGGSWGGAWKARWESKIANMTPEQREKFKAAWQKKCGPSNWMHETACWGENLGNAEGNPPTEPV